MKDFNYADLTNFGLVIYTVHKVNNRQIIEVWRDFMYRFKIPKLNSYNILYYRPTNQKDKDFIRFIDEMDKENGYTYTRFNRRYWVKSYKSLNHLLEDERRFVDEKTIRKIKGKTKNEFLKLKKQLEII